MTIGKRMLAGLALLLCVSLLAACGNGVEDAEAVTLSPLTPLDTAKLDDYTSDSDTVAQLEVLENSFVGLEATPAEKFTYTVENGSCTVTAYLGADSAVRIPETIEGVAVTALGDSLFAERETLQTLYIPDSVIALGKDMLKGCTSLKALRLPLTETEVSDEAEATDAFFLGSLFGATRYEDNPRDVPPSLNYLELGGSAQTLDAFALFECRNIELIRLPEGMEVLGEFSIFGCEKLIAINTEHLHALGERALGTCRALTVLTFGESLSEIGIGALEGCSELRALTLPFLGGSATQNTYLGYIFGAKVFDLSAGYYPQYLNRIELLATCTAIGDYALYECDMLTSVKLPDTVKTIGARSFSGCLYLSKLSVPKELTSIGDAAFFGCRSLDTLDFGATALSKIGVNAFYFCDGLTAVTLPNTVTALPSSCFAGCTKLAVINLDAVTSIGKNAFHSCPAFESID